MESRLGESGVPRGSIGLKDWRIEQSNNWRVGKEWHTQCYVCNPYIGRKQVFNQYITTSQSWPDGFHMTGKRWPKPKIIKMGGKAAFSDRMKAGTNELFRNSTLSTHSYLSTFAV